MARHLIRSLWFVPFAAAIVLQGCDKSPPVTSGHSARESTSVGVAQTESRASRLSATRSETPATRSIVVDAPREPSQDDPLPPWLAELFHDPNPNVRLQGLDAWARRPTTSLDPVTYALVDPDESVRARAQEILEQELARR
jgi:hypothetical protein